MSQEKFDMSIGSDCSTIPDFAHEVSLGSARLFRTPIELMHSTSRAARELTGAPALASHLVQQDGSYSCADDVLPTKYFLQLDSFVYAMLYTDCQPKAKPTCRVEDFLPAVEVSHAPNCDTFSRVPDIGRNSPSTALRLSAALLREFTEGFLGGSELVLRSGEALPFQGSILKPYGSGRSVAKDLELCSVFGNLYWEVLFSQDGAISTMEYMVRQEGAEWAWRANKASRRGSRWSEAVNQLYAELQKQVCNLHQVTTEMCAAIQNPFGDTCAYEWSARLEAHLQKQVCGVLNFWTVYALLGYLFAYDAPTAIRDVEASVTGRALSSNLSAWNRFLTEDFR